MENEAQEELRLRQYLLGQLAEPELTRVEERMMADDTYFELLLTVEDELIDDRTSGALSAADQEGFDRYYLSTAERRERAQFAEALKAHINQQVTDKPVPSLNDGSAPAPASRPA